MNENNNTTRDRNARAMNASRFTLTSIAREFNVDCKIARARMRRAIARNDERLNDVRELRNTNDMRVRYEFDNAHRDVIIAIVTRD